MIQCCINLQIKEVRRKASIYIYCKQNLQLIFSTNRQMFISKNITISKVVLALILVDCYFCQHDHKATENNEMEQAKVQINKINILIDEKPSSTSCQDSDKANLQLKQCLSSLQTTFNNQPSPSVGQQNKRKLQDARVDLRRLQEQKDLASRCLILQKRLKVSLLQKSEAQGALIKSKIAQRLAQDQVIKLKTTLNEYQQKLNDCGSKPIINDCSQCTCPNKNCDYCQQNLNNLREDYDKIKNESASLREKNNQHNAFSANWKSAIGFYAPKVKEEISHAISSHNISRFNSTKLSAILSEAQKIAKQSQNEKIGASFDKHKALLQQFSQQIVYLVKVATKLYSNVADQRNDILRQANNLLAQLKKCSKISKNEK